MPCIKVIPPPLPLRTTLQAVSSQAPPGGATNSHPGRLFTLSQTLAMSCSKLSLALVVDTQANRVLWAESGGDVVDVLFSFLTLPLGTVVRLLGKQSGLGCVDELYKSVEALDESYFQTSCCKNMLLRPRSAAERLCQNLRAKVDDIGDLDFYTCSDKNCIEERYGIVFSSVQGTSCRCGGVTNRIIKWGGSTDGAVDGVFIDRAGRFSISDDLCISQMSASSTISLLQRCGLKESQLTHTKVELSRERVLTLLQKSLTSKTPLTDMFLQKSVGGQPKEQLHYPIISTQTGCAERKFKARLVKGRASNEVMYAEVGGDVMDLLFSFLTIPLGSIVRLMMGNKGSHVGCMDNLYQSVEKLRATTHCAKLEKHKDMLLAPKLATYFGCSNQLLDIGETISFETTMINKCASFHCAKIPAPVCINGKKAQGAVQINPKLDNQSTTKGGCFVKGKPGTFMVTDKMAVNPNSSFSGLKMMNGHNVYVDDVEFREVTIGKNEALALLRGLLLSRTPLTHVFCQTKKKDSDIKTEADA